MPSEVPVDAKNIIADLKRQESEDIDFLPFGFSDYGNINDDDGLFNINIDGQMYSIIRLENTDEIVAWTFETGDLPLDALTHNVRFQIERAVSAWETRKQS